MSKKYLVTEVEGQSWDDKEELDPAGRWLTREAVYTVLRPITMDKDVEDILDELFGPEDSK